MAHGHEAPLSPLAELSQVTPFRVGIVGPERLHGIAGPPCDLGPLFGAQIGTGDGVRVEHASPIIARTGRAAERCPNLGGGADPQTTRWRVP